MRQDKQDTENSDTNVHCQALPQQMRGRNDQREVLRTKSRLRSVEFFDRVHKPMIKPCSVWAPPCCVLAVNSLFFAVHPFDCTSVSTLSPRSHSYSATATPSTPAARDWMKNRDVCLQWSRPFYSRPKGQMTFPANGPSCMSAVCLSVSLSVNLCSDLTPLYMSTMCFPVLQNCRLCLTLSQTPSRLAQACHKTHLHLTWLRSAGNQCFELEDYCKENAENENESSSINGCFPTEYLFTSMETDHFTFDWKTWRKNPEVKFGISLNFDEFNNKVEVASVADRSLAGEKNRRLSEIPAACSHILIPGDIIEAVNTQTEIEQIQRELQTALSINMRVARMKEHGEFGPPD